MDDNEPLRIRPDWSKDSKKEWIELLVETVRLQGKRITALEERVSELEMEA